MDKTSWTFSKVQKQQNRETVICQLNSLTVTMVIILDCYSEMDAHSCSEIGNFICSRHLLISTAKAVANLKEKAIFLHMCETGSELPSDIITMTVTRQKSFLYWIQLPSPFNKNNKIKKK